MWIRERTTDGATEQNRALLHPEEARLRAYVERWAIPRHLFANARNNRWVREDLAGTFARFELSVEIQGRFGNVLAMPRDSSGAPLTFIAAHYDSVPDVPGADDNASGLAVMMECARVFA